MAIKIEFVNLIIPIENINRSTFEGGFEKHLEEYKDLIAKAGNVDHIRSDRLPQ